MYTLLLPLKQKQVKTKTLSAGSKSRGNSKVSTFSLMCRWQLDSRSAYDPYLYSIMLVHVRIKSTRVAEKLISVHAVAIDWTACFARALNLLAVYATTG